MKIRSAQHIIDFGSRKIPYRLHRADLKHLRIVVSPELTVDIFAPQSASDEQVRAAIKKKTPWIVRTLNKLECYHPLPTPKRYLSGETFVYLGRQYRLKVENGSQQPAKLLGRFLWVWSEDKTGAQSVKRSVEAWYRKRAHETLGRYMEKCYSIASRHGVPEPSVMSIVKRRVKTGQFGPCILGCELPIHLGTLVVSEFLPGQRFSSDNLNVIDSSV